MYVNWTITLLSPTLHFPQTTRWPLGYHHHWGNPVTTQVSFGFDVYAYVPSTHSTPNHLIVLHFPPSHHTRAASWGYHTQEKGKGKTSTTSPYTTTLEISYQVLLLKILFGKRRMSSHLLPYIPIELQGDPFEDTRRDGRDTINIPWPARYLYRALPLYLIPPPFVWLSFLYSWSWIYLPETPRFEKDDTIDRYDEESRRMTTQHSECPLAGIPKGDGLISKTNERGTRRKERNT